ncbi:MAG: precorrin-8X methylmutase [Deltaproteobacteria bacterium]|nr:precorrin-8X methylmutase [Deltaproteobacteria bacterium]
MKPFEIEIESFRIIDEEAGSHSYPLDEWSIRRRMIHTSADFEYKDSVRLNGDAIEKGVEAILNGKNVITDTNMAKSGVRTKSLNKYGGDSYCLISESSIIETAKKNVITRARASVDASASLMEGGIYAVGNAPTALIRLIELIKSEEIKPALILGFPVGFVNAAESKEMLMELDVPYITNIGRKGGSNIAAAVVNALIILAEAKG